MKLIPKAFRTLAIAMLLAAPTMMFTADPSDAEEPIAVDAPAPYEPPNQVLEIPQSCTLDGAPVACDDSNASAAEDGSADGSNADAAADPNGGGTEAVAKAEGDAADQTAGQEWGTAQDYQTQGAMGGGPMVSAAVPYASGSMPSAIYVERPMVMVRPVPIGPYMGAAGPFGPGVIAAPGPVAGARPAWMFAPTPMRPMTMSPMMPMGMPGMFRLR